MIDTLQDPSALPKFIQISEFLIREIASGRLIDGERLPPERDMAAGLGVSVGTLRKSLKELEVKGLLERVQGSGNYIRHGPIEDSVYAMFRLELCGGGGLPRADVIDVGLHTKPKGMPRFGSSAKASRIRRLRYLNETIIAVEEIWLDADAGLVVADGLSDSLYHHYRTKLGLWIARAEDQVSIGRVPDWCPEDFPLRPGTLTGFVERRSWSDAATPVEYSRTWFDTERARYVQRLK